MNMSDTSKLVEAAPAGKPEDVVTNFVADFVRDQRVKQERDIEEIAASAYLTRGGRRLLVFPERLEKAVKLRESYAAGIGHEDAEICNLDQSNAFWAAMTDEIAVESPECRLRILRRLHRLGKEYGKSNEVKMPG
jgi:hypothetical protein